MLHDPTPAADLPHAKETVVNTDAGYQRMEKRGEIHGKGIGCPVSMRPEMRHALSETPKRLDDLIETANAHVRAKGEHPSRVIKQQFGSQQTSLVGMHKNGCNFNLLSVLANLFMACHQ